MLIFTKLLPIFVLVLSLLGIVHFSGLQSTDKVEVSDFFSTVRTTEAKNTNEYISGTPVEITIPSVEIRAKIKPGKYSEDKNEWFISKDNAHFATVTSLPNNKSGDTLIYAHNSNKLFGRTGKIKKSDKAYIRTSNNQVFEYIFESEQEVLPTNVDVLTYEGPARLTVLTCSGLWDEKRRLTHFRFVKVL